MSQKRNPDDFGNSSADDKRRKSLTSFQSVVQEVMRQNKFKDILEPMLRRVVKEEVESAIKKHVISFKRNCEDVLPSESRSLKLKFLSTLYLPVFTGTRIEGEDGSAIKVALVDALTDEIVQYAPESSAKIEIVVLEGDFDGDDGGNWTLEEFKNNIVREREGKKPILTGDVYMYLKEGIGSVGEISFTDNSSWTRSRRFRLGARAVGNYDGAGIREAKTESFIVRDHRGELYKKHHPPSLSDEVWRLEKIGKDGAFHKRLSLDRVNTVKDFLILLNLNPARLRNILGSGMSAKMWDVTTDHARTCVLDKRVYVYYSPNSQHSNGVVFNMVGHVLGFYSESQYVPIDKLSETEKLDAQRMVIEAFQHRDGVLSFEDLNSLHGITPDTASSSKTRMQEQLDCGQPSASSPDMLSSLYSMGCMSSSDDFSLQGVDTLDLTYSDIPIQIPDPLLCETNSLLPSFHDDNHLGLFDPDYSLQPMNSGFDPQANLLNTYDELIVSHSSAHAVRGPGQRRWRILSSVITWFSVRKDVLIKRMKGEYTIKKCRETISFHGDHNCKY